MKQGLFFILLVLLGSCYSTKTAKKQVIKAQVNYPNVVAEYCGNLYPPITETKIIEQLITGSTDTIQGETKFVNCDSLATVSNTGYAGTIAVPCPPSTHRVDTFTKTIETTVENTAKIKSLQYEVNNRELLLYFSLFFNLIFILYFIIKYFNYVKKK